MDLIGTDQVVELLTPGGWVTPKGEVRQRPINWFGIAAQALTFEDETGATVVMPTSLVIAVRTQAGPVPPSPKPDVLDPATAALRLTTQSPFGGSRSNPAFIGSERTGHRG